MGKPMSVDLRERVVAAVDGGISRRKAAGRLGVSISSAIRWTSRARCSGSVRPEPQGGDKRSARIEAHAPAILGAVEDTPDITLAELRELLAGRGGGGHLDAVALLRPAADHAQNRARTPPSRIARMS